MSINRYICSVFFVIGVFSCKKQSSKPHVVQVETANGQPFQIPIYENLDSVPACSGKFINTITFVKSDKHFYICEVDTWVKVENQIEKEVVKIQAPSESWKEIFKKTVISSAYMEAKYSGDINCEIYLSGSGFVIADNIIMTSAHVVLPSVTNQICSNNKLVQLRAWYPENSKGETNHHINGASASATHIDRSYDKNDLAFIKIDTLKLPSLDLVSDKAEEQPAPGDELLLLGYSSSSTHAQLVTGGINSVKPADKNPGGHLRALVVEGLIEDKTMLLQYDLVSGGGASGGALINSEGKVIGVNAAGDTEQADTEFAYGIHVQHIREFIAAERQWLPIEEKTDSP